MFSSHVDDILVYKNCCGVTPFIHDNRELFTWIMDHPQMSDIGADWYFDGAYLHTNAHCD